MAPELRPGWTDRLPVYVASALAALVAVVLLMTIVVPGALSLGVHVVGFGAPTVAALLGLARARDNTAGIRDIRRRLNGGLLREQLKRDYGVALGATPARFRNVHAS